MSARVLGRRFACDIVSGLCLSIVQAIAAKNGRPDLVNLTGSGSHSLMLGP
jgi:hypothetical protein